MREAIRIKDIPDSLLNDIGSSLEHYLVSILGRDDKRRAGPVRLIGSGTLVKVDFGYHVLTAAHVWNAVAEFPTIGLQLTFSSSCFWIRSAHIEARKLEGSNSEGFGPDLAFLAIPAADVGQILADKSALDLSQQRNKFLADVSRPYAGLFAVTGMVEGFSSIQQGLEQRTVEANVHERAFFGVIDEIHERDGYDYLDVGADMGLAAVPSSFGGVSGGALWRIRLSGNKAGQIFWGGKKDFYGVAFWQSAIREGRRIIRCHGPKSVFEKAWKEWGLPN